MSSPVRIFIFFIVMSISDYFLFVSWLPYFEVNDLIHQKLWSLFIIRISSRPNSTQKTSSRSEDWPSLIRITLVISLVYVRS